MSERTEERVSHLVAEALGLELDEVTPASSMETVEGWDSLQHLSVVVAIEAEFGCSITPEEVGELSSVKKITEYLERAKT